MKSDNLNFMAQTPKGRRDGIRRKTSLPVRRLAGMALCLMLAFSAVTEIMAAEIQPQSVFNRGNFYFEKGDFNEALEQYRQIEKADFSSGPLFLNMAISLTHLDSLGLAKYYYIKASAYPSTKKQARDGLEFVESRLNQRVGSVSSLNWITFLDTLYFEIKRKTLIISGIIALNFGLILLVITWFSNTWKKTLAAAGRVIAAGGLFLVISAVALETHTANLSRAVLIDHESEMVNEPGSSDEIITLVYEGYVFTLDENKSLQHENWKFARLRNGLSGWIPEESIRIL